MLSAPALWLIDALVIGVALRPPVAAMPLDAQRREILRLLDAIESPIVGEPRLA